ncbi:MAG: ABC transporter ATP-binding protein [Verrucomicrobiaceae bacterium]|nr:ABC transporter ATP-binding protein [Verrucomicrobiaceae bacterium]
MPLVELKNVSRHYVDPGSGQRVKVLSHVSLTIEPGESLAIVGPSGCGKSTLLNILGTLDLPDEGELWFEGKSMKELPPASLADFRSQHLGFIFQLHHLLPQCTVLENVLMPALALKQHDAKATLARAKQLLSAVGLQDRMQWKPAQLSGGERQRAAVVRALINQPKLILADEPTGALDEANAAVLTDLLLSLQKETGVALVLVTHHPAQAARMSRTLSLKEGTLSSTIG